MEKTHPGAVLRKTIRERTVLGPFMKTLDGGFVEAAGHAGFDFVILDQEHGPAGYETLGNLIRAAEVAGVASIVRAPHLSEDAVAKPLDLGAAGVQLPNVATAEDVRRFVRMARFAPKGARGVCRFVRGARYSAMDRAAYFPRANEAFLVVQVEGKEGLANLDEILAVEGYDVCFVGPYDLSQSIGKIGQIDAPEVSAAVESLLVKARAAGKEVGIFADTVPAAKRWKSLGVRYLSYSVDVGLFYDHCRDIVQTLA